MLERLHKEAYRITAERATQAVQKGSLEDAKLPEKQMVAIRELETARKEIFSKYGVPDIEPHTTEPRPNFS